MDLRAVTTEAIILRGRDYKEADRILVVLTRDYGKLPLIAKGVRKSVSKIKGPTQLFCCSKLTFRKSGSMGIITQGETIHSWQGLRQGLHKIACASYVGELVDLAMADEKPSEELVLLVFSILALLESGQEKQLLLRFFELRLLAALGYQPYLKSCLICGRSLPQGHFLLAPARGGIVCQTCKGPYQGKPLSVGAIMTMERLLTWDIRKIFQLKIAPAMMREIDQALAFYLEYYLERSAKARSALEAYLQV